MTGREDAPCCSGGLSGKALGTKLKQLGFDLSQEQLNEVFKRFIGVADKKKSISDEDILALVNEEVHAPAAIVTLVDLQVMCGMESLPTASVVLKGPDGVARRAAAIGTGPVDAAYKAIAWLSPVQCRLLDYNVSAITEGIDALVQTRVVIEPEEQLLSDDEEGLVPQVPQRVAPPTMAVRRRHTFPGSGADEDIVVSSARAYVSALNKAIAYLAAKKQISSLKKTAARVNVAAAAAASKAGKAKAPGGAASATPSGAAAAPAA